MAGALIGAVVALGALALGTLANQSDPYVILIVLTIGLVGLGLGAAASMYAYVSASLIVIVGATASIGVSSTPIDNIVRYGAFVIGSPILILLALRIERQHDAMLEARDASLAALRRLDAERHAAVVARREQSVALHLAQQERRRLEEVAEAIPEPLIVYDAEGKGTYANRAAMRLFGRSFVERGTEEWGRTTEPRDEHGARLAPADYPQVKAQGQPLRERMTVRLPMSGRDLLVDIEGTPIPGGGCVLLLRDVGKEEDERRRLSRFASFVAHELRNPLAVARARIELAQREPQLPERAATHGTRALESVESAIAILERLEMYSRADVGMVEAEIGPFDPRAALEAAIERLRARGSERRVRVRVSGQPRALGDRRLAEQAITNLLTNADRYSEPNRPIHVELGEEDQVVIRVADEGPGIADAVADRLFRDRVAAGRGLGLGLFLVRAMMQAQGGSVQLDQRRPGAVFSLRWPRAVEDGARPARTGKKEGSRRRDPEAEGADDPAAAQAEAR
jgi:signal transduction histidine kinase